MNINNFLHKENISTLWDVISDEELFRFLPKPYQNEILQVFSNNIRGFFESEKAKNVNLVDINKKYIMLILNYIKQNLNQKMPSKITILEDESNREPITYEDLQTVRLSQFDKDLNRRQEEFTSSMVLNVPEPPKFTDNYEDKPITGIDTIIKEMTAKRNYEVEQINRSYSSDINQATNWLKPQDTSVKIEKFMPQTNQAFTQNQSPRFKHINLNDVNVSSEKNTMKKTVSWENNSKEMEECDLNDEIEMNLFKKLKRVSNNNSDNSNNITITVEETISPDVRLSNLEKQIKVLNEKFDTFLQILQQKK
jgi:hypothetical protein